MDYASVHKCSDNLPSSEECAPQHVVDTTSPLTNLGSAPTLDPEIDSLTTELTDIAAMESNLDLDDLE